MLITLMVDAISQGFQASAYCLLEVLRYCACVSARLVCTSKLREAQKIYNLQNK